MARRSSRSASKGGSTIYGLLAGLLLGLVVAAVVAFYVTKAPVPFMDRAGRAPTPTQTVLPGTSSGGAALPDPNRGLQSSTNVAPPDIRIQPPSIPNGATSAPTPAHRGDELGALIASLPGQPSAPVPKPANGAAASAYFLQVGAYQVLEDAEALRARLLLQGLPVQIQRAEVNGLQVNRVRIGPYTKLDEMNRTRTRLAQENIPSTVIRQ